MKKDINEILTEEMKRTLEVLLLGVTVVDADGYYRYINQSGMELYHVTEEEVIGKTGEELEEARIFYPSFGSKVAKTGEKVIERQVNRLGEEYFTTVVPIKDNDGNVMCVIGYTSWEVESVNAMKECLNRLELLNNKMYNRLLTLKNWSGYENDFSTVIAENSNSKKIIEQLKKYANVDIPIFIYGPEGTGKNFLAHYMHTISKRSKNPFTVIDIKDFPEEMMEDELFGNMYKVGAIDFCDKGTLVIKNVEFLPVTVQKKLQYFIHNKVCKDYSGNEKSNSARIVMTSKHSPKELLRDKRICNELYYSVSMVPLKILPLNMRQDDLYEYINYYISYYNSRHHRNVKLLSDAMDVLLGYEWPQNLDELRAVMESVVVENTGNTVHAYQLPANISNNARNMYVGNIDLKEYIEFYEGLLIRKSFEKCGTTTGVAKELNISQATAVRKLQKYIPNYGVSVEDD